MYKKLVTFEDYILFALGRNRFNYSKTGTLIETLETSLKGITREREFDKKIENSKIKERLEDAEGLDGDDFEDVVEKFKKDNRIR